MSNNKALEIVLRHEYGKIQEQKNPFTREMMKKWFENKVKKIPKTSARIVSVVKNVSANKAALAALKQRLDVETVKKHYKPEFFFDLLRNVPQNSNAMNAMVHLTTRRISPERLLRDLLTYDVESFPAMPMAVARILALRKIPIEKLVRMAVEKRNNNSRYADVAASDDLLAIFRAVERSTKKKIDFSKVGASDMFVLLVDRNDEFLESVAENIESMDVLILLAFMIKRGAPRPPLEEILRYALHYEEELGFDEWTVPHEFYALLHLYDRATLKDATILPGILKLYAAMRTDDVLGRSADMRRILDRIVLPKNILDTFFETFSKSVYKPAIPAGDIEYLMARGAVVTKKTVAAFEKYAERMETGNVANVANAYHSVLHALNDAEHLKNYEPISNVFKNVVDNVRRIRLRTWLDKRDKAARTIQRAVRRTVLPRAARSPLKMNADGLKIPRHKLIMFEGQPFHAGKIFKEIGRFSSNGNYIWRHSNDAQKKNIMQKSGFVGRLLHTNMPNPNAVVREMQNIGVHIDGRDFSGHVPLHYAVMNGGAALVKRLLDMGANPNAISTQFRETPLHLAAKAGKIPVIKVLLEYGANPMAKDKYGDTPFAFARSRNVENALRGN